MRGRLPAGQGLLLLAVLIVGMNMRGAIAAVSPVLPAIREELSLSAATAGLLTTLPVLCFAAAAPLAAWLGRHIGLERAVALGLFGIAVGTVARVLGGTATLLVGTLVIGVAMTLGNVLVPVVTKRDFGMHSGTVTGLYTATLAGGAAATAALTAPIADQSSWRTALAAWALLALVALVVWQLAFRADRAGTSEGAGDAAVPGAASGVWRHPVAWAVTLVLGTQSMAYYVMTAWLPTLLMDDPGVDLATAGLAMSVFQVIGIAGTLLIPAVATRWRHQSWLSVSIAAGWALMVAGLLTLPSAWLLWSVVGGVAQGAGISLAFTVLVLRSHDAVTVRRLSAMAQLVGYTLGALGPFVVGVLNEVTGGWTTPLLLLLVVCAVMAAAGWVAGGDVQVGRPTAAASR